LLPHILLHFLCFICVLFSAHLTTTNAFCLDWLEEFEFYMTNNDTDGFRYFVCVCAVGSDAARYWTFFPFLN
jgi:hypothetical protein